MLVVGANEDGVVTLTLNRPEKRNALSIELREAISDALDALAGDDGVKVVIVTGAGDVFCAGFDLREFERMDEPEIADRLWPSSDRYHRACVDFPLPMIAAVNGPALAGGFDLAVMCDIRIASPKAAFSHPEISFGDVVYGPLHDLVGGAVARDLCLRGDASMRPRHWCYVWCPRSSRERACSTKLGATRSWSRKRSATCWYAPRRR